MNIKYAAAVVAILSLPASAMDQTPPAMAPESWIVGTWILTAADKLTPDGKRVIDYGPNPHGLVIFAADGWYSLQIYRAQRTKFASGDKFNGTLEEYRDASLGMSTSFGHYSVDSVKHIITFHIDRASIPNRDDLTSTLPYELNGDELSWKVTPRQDGSIPITVLRKNK